MKARKNASRKPAAKPVSEGIRRAAKRAGVEQNGTLLSVAERVGIPILSIPECEFRSITAQLKELTHVIVNAWANSDGLDEVLVKLHAARRNLETECAPLGGAS